MKNGDVSEVIQIDNAYTLVRLREHTPAGKAKFEDVQAQLKKELPQAKKEPASRRAGQEAAAERKDRRNVRGRVKVPGFGIKPKWGRLVSKDWHYERCEKCNKHEFAVSVLEH